MGEDEGLLEMVMSIIVITYKRIIALN